MSNNPQEKKVVSSALQQLQKKIDVASQAYNADKLKVTLLITGVDCNTGKPFAHTLTTEETNIYMKEFFNQWGAELCAEKISLHAELKRNGYTVIEHSNFS